MDIVNSVLHFTRKTALERSAVLLTDFAHRLREKSHYFLKGGCALLEIHVEAPPGLRGLDRCEKTSTRAA
jgi:hypothetical protein